LTPADNDHAADLFEATRATAAARGLPAYEISNHARPGAESRHNLTYWRYNDYVGIGPGAHGRRRGMATVRHKKPENWMNAVARNGHGAQTETPLSGQERATEALLMGLRLREGVDLAHIRQTSGIAAPVDRQAVARLRALDLLTLDDSNLKVTESGMLLLDSILAEIVA
jgi:coproporphyrinogen III oxidase-like Fe-S oxidoreductase